MAINFLTILPSNVGSLCPWDLGSVQAYDYFHQKQVAEERPCDIQGQVMKGREAPALFLGHLLLESLATM